jgi:acetylornithine deacetylase
VLDRTVEILDRLVSFPTISSDGNLDLIDYAKGLLEGAGARVSVTEDQAGKKANLFATIGPESNGGVILSGHTDVVPVEGQDWTRDPFRLAIEGGRAWGRGTTDMKGFIACVLAMAPVVASWDLARPVHVALTYDEEVGCHGAKVMLADLARSRPRPAIALVGEPTDEAIVIAHKGCYEYTTEIRGVERHASISAAGAGAIHAAARFVGMLDRLADEMADRAPADSPFAPPGTTFNVGTISGGVARNITAGGAVFEWEMRPINGADRDYALETVESFVQEVLLPSMRAEYPDASLTTTTVGAVGGFERDPNGPAVVLARRISPDSQLGVVSFGTEAGLYQELGISSVVFGPGSIDQAHKPDEFIELSQLERCLAMLGRLRDEI